VTNDDTPGVPRETAAMYRSHGWWRDATVLDDFLRVAAQQPDKIAMISDHAAGEREQHTYRQLVALVDQVAAGLLELGVQPGEIVSYQLPNWWQFTVLHLACARIVSELPKTATGKIQKFRLREESRQWDLAPPRPLTPAAGEA
jgi:non-ribosomal peptide synthetase component E (peptide arylation enzyme)